MKNITIMMMIFLFSILLGNTLDVYKISNSSTHNQKLLNSIKNITDDIQKNKKINELFSTYSEQELLEFAHELAKEDMLTTEGIVIISHLMKQWKFSFNADEYSNLILESQLHPMFISFLIDIIGKGVVLTENDKIKLYNSLLLIVNSTSTDSRLKEYLVSQLYHFKPIKFNENFNQPSNEYKIFLNENETERTRLLAVKTMYLGEDPFFIKAVFDVLNNPKSFPDKVVQTILKRFSNTKRSRKHIKEFYDIGMQQTEYNSIVWQCLRSLIWMSTRESFKHFDLLFHEFLNEMEFKAFSKYLPPKLNARLNFGKKMRPYQYPIMLLLQSENPADIKVGILMSEYVLIDESLPLLEKILINDSVDSDLKIMAKDAIEYINTTEIKKYMNDKQTMKNEKFKKNPKLLYVIPKGKVVQYWEDYINE